MFDMNFSPSSLLVLSRLIGKHSFILLHIYFKVEMMVLSDFLPLSPKLFECLFTNSLKGTDTVFLTD